MVFLFVKGCFAFLNEKLESIIIHHFQFTDYLLMFGMRNCGSFFPADYCGNIDVKNMGKDFLRDAQFLSEVSDIVSGGADERLRGDVCAEAAQMSLNHADTLL